MTIAGWITMGVCWSTVIVICIILIKKTLQTPEEK